MTETALKTYKVISIESCHYEQIVSATDKDAAVQKAVDTGYWAESGYSETEQEAVEISTWWKKGVLHHLYACKETSHDGDEKDYDSPFEEEDPLNGV